MDTEVFVLHIFKSKIHPCLTVEPFWQLFYLLVSILMGIPVPHTLGFIAIFFEFKMEMAFWIRSEIFETVYSSCDDEEKDYYFLN